MTFSNLAENINNIIHIMKAPLEIVCIQVKKVYSCLSRRNCFMVQWSYNQVFDKPTPLPPALIVSCNVIQVKPESCTLIPVRKGFVSVATRYLVHLQITYRDGAGNTGVVNLEHKNFYRSPPLPGTTFMHGEVDIAVGMLRCSLEELN